MLAREHELHREQRQPILLDGSAQIEQAFGKESMDHWLPLLTEIGVPAGEVRTIDRVYEWDQTRSQGLLIDVAHQTLGGISLPGPPLRFDDGGARAEHLAPPTLGQHDAQVRAWLDEQDARG